MLDALATSAGLIPILASFAFFRGLHFVVSIKLPPPPGIIQDQKKKRAQWMYYNICVSLFHSTITAFMSLYCFYNEPAMLSDMITVWTSTSYYLLCLSTGYFIHDFFDMLLNDLNRSTTLLMHHLLVIGAFVIAISTHKYSGFGACSLLMEVNSVFLHSRMMLRFHGVDRKGTLYQVNGILLLITFVFFRFLTSAWMMNFVIKVRNVIPASHVIYGGFAMAAMILLNIELFMTLWKSDFARDKQKQTAED